MEKTSEIELRRTYRVAAIIGLAMGLGVLMYLVIVQFLSTSPGFPREASTLPWADMLRYVFLGIALAEFFLINTVRRLMLRPRQGRNVQEGPFSATTVRLLTTSIITFAICESVAILGLVLFFLTREASDYYLLMAISLICFAVYFPRYGQWKAWVEAEEGGVGYPS